MPPVTKLSFEKYASATTVLQMGRSRSALRDSILRYQPVNESGSFIPFVHFGLRPLSFSANVCSALRNTTSFASASTTESPKNSRPRFIADAQPDQNQSRSGVFFPDFGTKQGSMAMAVRCLEAESMKCLLKAIQSNDFLKFWRNRLSHEREHLAIWVKFMRPDDVR